MLRIALTGGIGSGKSTVANLFARHGIPIIDADQVAREVVTPPNQAFQKIKDHFGKICLKANGDLDRQWLRQVIFKDPQQRRWLEDLLHPIIIDAIHSKIDKLTAPYCLIVIPLLFETKIPIEVDRICVVDTSPNLQINRTAAREEISVQEIKNIIAQQVDKQYRIQHADDIIDNQGNIAALATQVDKLHEKYLAMIRND